MSALAFNDGKLFKQVIKGDNFITPNLVGYFNNDTYVAELSQGTDFNNKTVYGVTVINHVLMERAIDMDQFFDNYTDAITYLKEILQ